MLTDKEILEIVDKIGFDRKLRTSNGNTIILPEKLFISFAREILKSAARERLEKEGIYVY